MFLHRLVAELTGRKDAHGLQCKISERFHQQCYKWESFNIRQVEVINFGSSTFWTDLDFTLGLSLYETWTVPTGCRLEPAVIKVWGKHNATESMMLLLNMI